MNDALEVNNSQKLKKNTIYPLLHIFSTIY